MFLKLTVSYSGEQREGEEECTAERPCIRALHGVLLLKCTLKMGRRKEK